jgi:hypothetical protein
MLQAQDRPPFDPKKFDADMEQFIAAHAGLTPSEAAHFFPLFEEMQNKQRQIFNKMRQYRFIDTSNDHACAEAIKRQDQMDLEIKKIQQAYHLKFMKVLSPGKVMKVIRAEDDFHRQAFKKAMRMHGARK